MFTKLKERLLKRTSNDNRKHKEVLKLVEISLTEHDDPILLEIEDRVSGSELFELLYASQDESTVERLKTYNSSIRDGSMKMVVNNMPVPLGVKAITPDSKIGFQGKGKNGL